MPHCRMRSVRPRDFCSALTVGGGGILLLFLFLVPAVRARDFGAGHPIRRDGQRQEDSARRGVPRSPWASPALLSSGAGQAARVIAARLGEFGDPPPPPTAQKAQENAPITPIVEDFRALTGRSIVGIEVFVGEKPVRDPPHEVYGALTLRPHQPFRLVDVRRLIQQLYEKALASDVIVEAEEKPEGVILRLHLTPQPRIGRVGFEGADPEAVEQILPRLGEVDPGTRLTPRVLDRAAEEIVSWYQAQGFFDCEVTPTVSLTDEGRTAHVTFVVKPGTLATVGDVRVVGDLAFDAADLLNRMQTRKGAPYRALALQDDLRLIRQIHLERGYLSPQVSQPRLARDAETNTVSIEIVVRSGPLVRVKVEGIELSPEEHRRLLPILRQGGLDEATLEEGRLALLDYVQREGFFFARVTVSHSGEGTQQTVTYTVDRGRKYKLQDIRIEGANSLTWADVAPRAGSRLGGFLTRGLTSHDLMERDREAILEALRHHGYRNARVVASRLAVSLKKEDLIIVYVVEPGSQYTIGEIAFVGPSAQLETELREQIGLRQGDIFSESRVSEAATRLLTYYHERGYAEVEIRPETVELPESRVRLVFHVTEGKKLSIGRILIRGAERTSEAAIHRYLTFRQGDVLRPDWLKQSEENLYATGAFRRVSITAERSPSATEGTNARTIVVDVSEAPRNQMTYGFGFRTDDGPRGLFEITNTNLFGHLWTGSFRLRGSRREQLGQISYTDPRPFGHDVPVLFSLLFQRQQEVAFDASRATILGQVEKRLAEKSFLFFRYNFSNVIISNVTQPEELRRQDTTVQLGRISVTYLRDMRDDPLDPAKGDVTTLDLALVARALGGSESFVRFYGEHARVHPIPLLPDTFFALDVRVGLAWPYGSSFAVPISERFFAGGSTTLRGFGFEQAGPRAPDPNRPGQTRPIGGNALAILNGELRFPLLRALRLHGAAFYDGGNVFARVSDFRLRDFSHTVGVGLRIKTPIGPLRLDWGILVRRQPGIPRTQLHATFGNPF